MRDLVDQMGGIHGRPPINDDHGSSRSVKLHDFEMVLHYAKRDAIFVSLDGETTFWLPKSQIEFQRTGYEKPAIKTDGQRTILPVVKVSVPDWLARKEGLI